MKLIIRSFDLPLKHTFTIAHDSRTVQKTLIVELSDDGFSGFGEATATPYYGMTIEKMTDILINLKPVIENYKITTPEAFWDFLYPYLKDFPFVHCALDVAANDLYGKKLGKPLYEIWGYKLKNLPLSNYTIGIDTIDKMVEKIEEMPWPVYKIKLGTKHDVEIIKALRKKTNAVFRVDANCGWTADETIEYSKKLEKLNVEFIEQPLAENDFAGQKKVHKQSVLPVIADESCQREEDIEKCYGLFDGVNIKLMKCGGLTPARRMIKRAKELGMKVMTGCMTESTIGISAIAHLLPILDYVDMDGPLLLKEDIATGVKIEFGKVIFSRENGTGAMLAKE